MHPSARLPTVDDSEDSVFCADNLDFELGTRRRTSIDTQLTAIDRTSEKPCKYPQAGLVSEF